MDEVILPAGFFQGTFDGRGHTVTLNIDKSGNVTQRQIGLFRAITSGCVIQNLHVAGSITIDDTNQNTSLFIGGIMGNMWQPGVTLKNCVSSVNMTVTSPTSNLAVGGLIGIAANGITIEHCYARGTISVSATNSSSMTRYGVGGIVGVIGNSLESAVVTGGFSNSVSLAGISGGRSPPEAFTSTTMGVRRILGIVASYITNEVTFSNNYALGTVTITDFTGPVSTQPANADRDGIPAAANDIDSETWWRTTAGWESVWGGDNPTLDAPWVWDSTAKRPKLYKFD
jgi:hypothetical protein